MTAPRRGGPPSFTPEEQEFARKLQRNFGKKEEGMSTVPRSSKGVQGQDKRFCLQMCHPRESKAPY